MVFVPKASSVIWMSATFVPKLLSVFSLMFVTVLFNAIAVGSSFISFMSRVNNSLKLRLPLSVEVILMPNVGSFS